MFVCVQPIPPAYDMEPVKSLALMLQEESAEQFEQRMTIERRQRLEMALAMRTRHLEQVENVEKFHGLEKQRLELKAKLKVLPVFGVCIACVWCIIACVWCICEISQVRLNYGTDFNWPFY